MVSFIQRCTHRECPDGKVGEPASYVVCQRCWRGSICRTCKYAEDRPYVNRCTTALALVLSGLGIHLLITLGTSL